MAISWDDFDKIWASTSPLTPYSFSDNNYKQGWNFVGATPPARQMWDSIQKANDEKFKFLRDNFGTPNIVTTASQMTDTGKVYVYMGSEAGWNNGHWYYYDEGTSSWADGGVYNSVAFVTDTTLSIAGQPADAKATGDALALKSDLAGCTFTGNVSVNADLSVTGDATIGTDLSVTGSSTLTGNVTTNGNINAVGDISSANLTTTNATVTGDVSCANLTTSADASVGGDLTVTGDSTLADTTVDDLVINNDLSVAGDSSLTNLSVSGTTALAGTSTAPTPSADDNSTKIATTEYVQTEIKPIETDVDIAEKDIANIKALLQGHLYYYQTDSTSSYAKSVPAGAMPYAGLEQIGGKTLVWNQLVDSGTTTVATISGHKYYTLISGTASIVTADGSAISVVDDTTDMVTDLTLCYGSGNEPTTVAEFTAQFPAQYYPYNAGTLLSAGVTEVVSKKADTSTIATYSIPAEIQSLDGYGWSAGTAYNYIDYERKVFAKNVGRVDLGTLDWFRQEPPGQSAYFQVNTRYLPMGVPINVTIYTPDNPGWWQNIKGYALVTPWYVTHSADKTISSTVTNGALALRICDTSFISATAEAFKTAMNGVYLYYELETPVETDISAYLSDDNLIEVEAGGTLTFENQHGDNYRIPVPSTEEYMINLQEAVSNG